MADIFISYAGEDRQRIEELADALEHAGWTVWWAPEIPVGRPYDEVIEEELHAARCVIVVWTTSSVRSQWVRSEATVGQQRKVLVPVKFDAVELPLGFNLAQTADLSDWKLGARHQEFERLQESIARLAPQGPGREGGRGTDSADRSDGSKRRRFSPLRLIPIDRWQPFGPGSKGAAAFVAVGVATVAAVSLALFPDGEGGRDGAGNGTPDENGPRSVLFLVGDPQKLFGLDRWLHEQLETVHDASVTVETADDFSASELDALAQEHNLVLISESVRSAGLVEDDRFKLHETPVPIVSFEVYVWDEAAWSGGSELGGHGNTGRNDLLSAPAGAILGGAQTDVYITDEGTEHPMGAGFAAGALTVHEFSYSVNFGTPSPDATWIATADPEGKWPSHFVYEAGDALVDHSAAPAARIAMFVGQATTIDGDRANRVPGEDIYTQDGEKLINAALAYALSLE